MSLSITANQSEISCFSLIEIFTSHRESNKNHKKKYFTENFPEMLTSKQNTSIKFQLSGIFSEKAKLNLTVDIFFRHSGRSVKVKLWALKNWSDRHARRPALLRVKKLLIAAYLTQNWARFDTWQFSNSFGAYITCYDN